MIYHHFGSKEGLFRAVVEHEYGAWPGLAPGDGRGAEMEPHEGMRLAFCTMFDHCTPAAADPAGPAGGLGGWGIRPPLPADALPAELRDLHDRGVEAGIFRADVAFEVLYATAVMTLMGTPALAGRFPAVLAEAGHDATARPDGGAAVGRTDGGETMTVLVVGARTDGPGAGAGPGPARRRRADHRQARRRTSPARGARACRTAAWRCSRTSGGRRLLAAGRSQPGQVFLRGSPCGRRRWGRR